MFLPGPPVGNRERAEGSAAPTGIATSPWPSASAASTHPSCPSLGVARADGRFACLDAYRGITIAVMLVVNNPGSGSYVYWPLRHAGWEGFTLADAVFPSFLFIVGASMAFSFARRRTDKQQPASVLLRALRRAVALFVLGVALTGYPYYDVSSLRIMGVLQRIALAYLLAAITLLALPRRGVWLTCGIVLIGYWLLLEAVPAPGFAAGDFSAEGNLATYVDRLALTPGHLFNGGPGDPEGLLATLPAMVTVLIGYLAAEELRRRGTGGRASLTLVLAGCGALATGYAWSFQFPINKQLWTSSYTLVAAGCSLLLLGLCYEAIEVRRWRGWSQPFAVIGTNAITVYVASNILQDALERSGTRALLFAKLEAIGDPWVASLLYALATTAVWALMPYALHRRGLFVKI